MAPTLRNESKLTQKQRLNIAKNKQNYFLQTNEYRNGEYIIGWHRKKELNLKHDYCLLTMPHNRIGYKVNLSHFFKDTNIDTHYLHNLGFVGGF